MIFKNYLSIFALSLTTSVATAQVGTTPTHPVEPPKWTLEGEAAVVAAAGNTHTQSYSLKERVEYPWSIYRIKEDVRYLRGRNLGVDSAEQWAAAVRFEVSFAESWRAFLAQNAESDHFAGFYGRYNTDFGAQYTFLKDDRTEITAEGGYRFLANDPVIGDLSIEQRGRVASRLAHIVRPGFSVGLAVEALATLNHSDNWEMNGSASVNYVLTQIFSIKSAYELKYRNLPALLPGGVLASSFDGLFTTSLVAKF